MGGRDALLDGPNQGEDDAVRLSPDYVIGILEAFLGQESDVNAPQNNGEIAGTQVAGHAVGFVTSGSGRRDPHQVRGQNPGPWERRGAILVKLHLVAGFFQPGSQQGQTQARHADPAENMIPSLDRLNQNNLFHEIAPFPGASEHRHLLIARYEHSIPFSGSFNYKNGLWSGSVESLPCFNRGYCHFINPTFISCPYSSPPMS